MWTVSSSLKIGLRAQIREAAHKLQVFLAPSSNISSFPAAAHVALEDHGGIFGLFYTRGDWPSDRITRFLPSLETTGGQGQLYVLHLAIMADTGINHLVTSYACKGFCLSHQFLFYLYPVS